MAPEEVKGKKRKGAAEASPKPKKQKKSDDTVASKKAKAVKAAEEPAAKYKAVDTPMNDAPASEKKSKKKGKAPESAVEPVVEKPKKSAKASAAKEEAPKEQATKSRKDKAKDTATSEETSAVSESKKSKKSKKNKAQEEAKEPSPEVPADEQDGETDEDDDVDDQTAALLAGFESDRDESDAEKEDQGLTDADLEGKVPTGIMKKLKDVSHNEQKPGVIFVGRIPHGFYEKQMKSYFSQFGKVTRLRVSRNKKTGAPKHYAFVEFASSEVAEIVAKTMDKYLMFGHILQCRVIPSEQVHPNLFVGANQRYKRIPRNKMAGNEMLRGAERAVWEKRVEKETKKRAKKNKKLQEKLGYEYKAPELKSVEDVPKKAAALEDAPGTQLLTELDAAAKETPAQIEEAKTEESAAAAGIELKKSNKTTKRKAEATAETADTAEKHEASEQKPKKSKKAKVEPNAQRDDAPPEEVKTKKAKKVTKGEAEEDLPKEKKRKSLSSTDVAGAKSKKTKKSKA